MARGLKKCRDILVSKRTSPVEMILNFNSESIDSKIYQNIITSINTPVVQNVNPYVHLIVRKVYEAIIT